MNDGIEKARPEQDMEACCATVFTWQKNKEHQCSLQAWGSGPAGPTYLQPELRAMASQ